MRTPSRRDVVKLASGLAVGVGGFAATTAAAQVPKKPGGPPPLADADLERASKGLLGFMFVEQATSEIKGGGVGHSLFVTSACGSDGTPGRAAVRAGAATVFRSDLAPDEFTRKGGFYWECGGEKGKVQFEKSVLLGWGRGPLVMAVRESGGTVRWYSLATDYRC